MAVDSETTHAQLAKIIPAYRHREAAPAAAAIQKRPRKPMLPGLLRCARNDGERSKLTAIGVRRRKQKRVACGVIRTKVRAGKQFTAKRRPREGGDPR